MKALYVIVLCLIPFYLNGENSIIPQSKVEEKAPSKVESAEDKKQRLMKMIEKAMNEREAKFRKEREVPVVEKHKFIFLFSYECPGMLDGIKKIFAYRQAYPDAEIHLEMGNSLKDKVEYQQVLNNDANDALRRFPETTKFHTALGELDLSYKMVCDTKQFTKWDMLYAPALIFLPRNSDRFYKWKGIPDQKVFTKNMQQASR